ncbi:hypothetical protein RD1_1545 [Roseobacter denitrificans OCh 114]|uniref:Uncharacterized protein n=1 Tax=Roseobacter denitrificans (strain ATCC 33942 / OCh 114) TaxID=375451 RepID=Q16A19_ROSDO|nr:hypothetical protein RD1_1545 [Roseobacter denitrificans OCh 114]
MSGTLVITRPDVFADLRRGVFGVLPPRTRG